MPTSIFYFPETKHPSRKWLRVSILNILNLQAKTPRRETCPLKLTSKYLGYKYQNRYWRSRTAYLVICITYSKKTWNDPFLLISRRISWPLVSARGTVSPAAAPNTAGTCRVGQGRATVTGGTGRSGVGKCLPGGGGGDRF